MAFRSSAVTALTGGATAATMPTGIVVGDQLRAVLFIDDTSTLTITAPTGWTLLDTILNSAPDGQNALLYSRTADGNESTQRTWSWPGAPTNNAQIIVGAWSGRGTGHTFFTQTSDQNSNASPVTCALASGTAATGDDIAWFGGIDPTSFSTGWVEGDPAGYTTRSNASVGWVTCGLATKDNVSSGAVGTLSGTFTQAGKVAGFLGFVLALPVAGGGGTNNLKTISANQTQTALVSKAISKGALTKTQVQTASLVKGQGFLKTLSATVTQTLTRLRSVGKKAAATQTQTTSAGPSVAMGVGVSAAQTQTPTRARALGAPKTGTETQTATRLRLVSPAAKSVINTQTPSLTKGQGYLKTLTVTIVQTGRARSRARPPALRYPGSDPRARGCDHARPIRRRDAIESNRESDRGRAGSDRHADCGAHEGD
jgi:hypothetical protein